MAFVLSLLSTIAVVLFSIIEQVYYLIFPRKLKPVCGKTVLITGGGGGLGKELAMEFSRLGARVVLLDIDEASNKRSAALACRPGMDAFAYTCDCSDEIQVKKVVAEIESELGGIDILVNNAGILHGRSLEMLSCQQIRSTMNVNVLAPFWMTKACLPSMIERKNGHIVTVASVAGLNGSAYLCDYSASKFALVGLHEALAHELRQEKLTGIKLTCVCPSFINTGMSWFPKTNVPWLLPILSATEAAVDIVNAMRMEEELVVLPRVLFSFIKGKWLLPARGVLAVREFLGLGIEPHVKSGVRRKFTTSQGTS